MEPRDSDAWNALLERALDALRRGSDPRKREGVRVVTILDLPVSGDARAWEIVRRRGGGEDRLTAARARWLRARDEERLRAGERDPAPTIEVEELAVDHAMLAGALRALRAIELPLSIDAEPDTVLDRATHELHLVGARLGVTLRWWGDPPFEWAPLATWARTLVSRLETP